MFRDGVDEYVMNRDRLLATAINAALDLSSTFSVERHEPLPMPGGEVCRDMFDWLNKSHDKGHLTSHDVTTGMQIATIVTGGNVEAGTLLNEDEICALERKGFLTLAKTEETRARIEFMLEHGSPLRN
jgi:3-hydroxyacyl-CoA dehydrogenase